MYFRAVQQCIKCLLDDIGRVLLIFWLLIRFFFLHWKFRYCVGWKTVTNTCETVLASESLVIWVKELFKTVWQYFFSKILNFRLIFRIERVSAKDLTFSPLDEGVYPWFHEVTYWTSGKLRSNRLFISEKLYLYVFMFCIK